LADAGRVGVPFTTGILIGIGETLTERAESLFAIRSSAREYGHLQETIVQNFRAKPDTAMRGMPDAELDDLAATIAVARIVLGPRMRIQAPPNLIGDEYLLMLRAGIDDWGGVSPLTPDHVNPERPWPAIDDLAARTADAGFRLAERLTIYPEYVRRGVPWLDPRLAAHVAALSDPVTGLAVEAAIPVGRPWQEPDDAYVAGGRTELFAEVDTVGRTDDRRSDFDSVYGDWSEVASHALSPRNQGCRPPARRCPARRPSWAVTISRSGCGWPPMTRPRCCDPNMRRPPCPLRMRRCAARPSGPTGRRSARRGSRRRRDVRGQPEHQLHQCLLRRLPILRVRTTRTRRRRISAVGRASRRSGRRSLEPRRDRGLHAGRHRSKMPKSGYADLVRAIKARVPGMHVHAFSPMEIVTAASKAGVSVRDWLVGLREAGLDTIPGTAAEILDDDVRWVLTKASCRRPPGSTSWPPHTRLASGPAPP